MAVKAPLGAVCDRGDCPALAAESVVLYDQDFYSRAHHTSELPAHLASHEPVDLPSERDADPQVQPGTGDERRPYDRGHHRP